MTTHIFFKKNKNMSETDRNHLTKLDPHLELRLKVMREMVAKLSKKPLEKVDWLK